MARPCYIVTRPAVGAPPLVSEGAGYVNGPRPGSYANQYAQPLAIGTVYVFTDTLQPQVTYVSPDGSVTVSTTLLAFVLDFIQPFYPKAFNPANPNAPTTTELQNAIILGLGPAQGTNPTYGQAPGWVWAITIGSL